MRLSDEKEAFYCHGGCADAGGKGDIFALHQFVTGGDFAAAVVELADWAGVRAQLTPDDQRRIERKRRVEDVLATAADFYAAQYPGSPAQVYAQGRHIEAPDARLGYAPDSWDGLASALRAAGVDLAQAEEAGLVKRRKDGTYYDVLRHRLIIPAFKAGRCVYLQGRSLGEGATANADDAQRKYKNIALDEPPLYHLNGALSGKHTPIVTESTTDVLRMSASGLPAVGTYGASLGSGQRATLERIARLVVAPHADAAGTKFADTLAQALGERITIAPPPSGCKDWAEALDAGHAFAADESLTWVRWRLRAIPADADSVLLSGLLAPILDYLAALDDPARASVYLDELKKYFSWPASIARGYEQQVKVRRAQRQQAATEAARVTHDDSGAIINILPPPDFINPAQAWHGGTIYLAHEVAGKVKKTDKRGNTREYTIYGPRIITSDRRVLPVPELPPDAPPGAVIFLDKEQTIATRKAIVMAGNSWSYDSINAHISGQAPEVEPHIIYDRLMATLRQYVYFATEGDYVTAVLWCMGTYFHQQFDAFPYLAIHGHKGSGKTTLLYWLRHLAFNAMLTVNSSEASLFRTVEALAPTMLIDEQEGLNSRKAAKEEKADLMGILKSGYQRGTMVMRQDPNNPSITQTFSVYSPKAIAAIEQFEDILEDRSILVYMPQVAAPVLAQAGIKARNTMQAADFTPLRDSLYLLLMQASDNLQTIRAGIANEQGGRFGELALPLLCLATLVDVSRGTGRQTLGLLTTALAEQKQKRASRNEQTPEALLAEAVRIVIDAAVPAHIAKAEPHAQLLPDGRVVMDSMHIRAASAQLFSGAKESFFNDSWLGKQIDKTEYISRWTPRRWHRVINEWSEQTREIVPTPKQPSVYVVDPRKLP